MNAVRILRGEPEFLGWIGRAQPGEAVIYHRGFLTVDRHGFPGRDLNRLANSAASAAAAGLVDLLQRRHGPEDTSYIAIARRPPAAFAHPRRQRAA